MKLAALHQNSSRQTFHHGRPVESAIAPATSPVLMANCVVMAPTSGFDSDDRSPRSAVPPSLAYATPVAAIVSASAAALNSVR